MHDLDRVLWEVEDEESDLELEALEMAAESAGWAAPRNGSVLSELEETEFATELLEVDSEEELTGWVGGLMRRAATGARDFLNSDTGKALGAMAKGAVKEGLPIIGQRIGEHYGGKGSIWGTVGQRAGKGLAGALFELDLEGLSAEDQELETARAAVRFVTAATRCAVTSPADLPPREAARRAFVVAARRYAPGLVGATARRPASRRARSGRWVRRGPAIVIFEG